MCERPLDCVFVRSEEGDESISLRFQLQGREHRLLRAKDEPVGRALQRIATNLSRNDRVKKKKRKGGGVAATSGPAETVSSVEVVLYAGGGEVAPETANIEAWVSGNTLRVGGVLFQVTVNTPCVKLLQLPSCLLTTCPAVPLVELEFADEEQCGWSWRRCSPTNHPLPPTAFPETPPTDARTPVDRQSLSSSCQGLLTNCPIISTSPVYWTSEEDNGHLLLVECTPYNTSGEKGQSVVVVSKCAVSKFTNLPMSERHLLTPTHLAESHHFRVISYNILANVYATSERAKSDLYPYCDPSALDHEYRQSVIARELVGYHGDIVCLQEVGTKCFSQFLSPSLHQWGYEGRFHAKAGRTPEGEAVFFNRSKFSLVCEEVAVLREFVQESPNCRDILSLHPLIVTDLLKRHNILQLVLLQSNEIPNSYVLVGNTHLYFHPMADHIRLLQVAITLRIIELKLGQYRQTFGSGARVAVVLCGDLNSCPRTGAYHYITRGSVSGSHPDWQLYQATEVAQCSCNHRALNVIHEDNGQWVEPQPAAAVSNTDSCTGLDLRHSLHFSNVCGTKFSTNITLGWTGVIDYIFIDSDWLGTLRFVPFPSPEHLTEHVALPSVNFPSDHLPLVADLTWTTE